MDPWTLIVYGLSFSAFYMLIEGVYYTFLRGRTTGDKRVNQRMWRYATRAGTSEMEETTILIDIDDRPPLLLRMVQLLPRRRSVELFLYRAGMPLNLVQFSVLSLLLGVGGVALGAAVLPGPWFAAPLAIAGLLPTTVISMMKARRMARFEEQFPEALEVLCRTIRAGHSLQFGFQMVATELMDPVASEFGHVADEISLGMETRLAVQNLAHRMNTSDMPFFSNALLIQRETGGNLAELLENLGRIVRQRTDFYGKVRGLTAQMKFSSNVLATIPVLMGGAIYLMNPDYLKPMLEDEYGRLLLALAGFLVIVGFVLSRRLGIVKV